MANQNLRVEARQSEADALHHAARIRNMLTRLIEHARQDAGQIEDARARALFETTAEVLTGLRKAYEHYEQTREEGWRKAS